MIKAIVGGLGSGKSYCAVSMLLDELRAGGTVQTNIKLYGVERLEGKYIYEPAPSPLNMIRGFPRGSGAPTVIICLDEFPVILAETGGYKNWADWLAHSDKNGIDLYIILQARSQVPRALFDLCASVIRIYSVSQRKVFGFKMRVPVSWAIEEGLDGVEFERRQYIRGPQVWQHYQTSHEFGKAGQVARQESQKIEYPWKKTACIWITLLLMLVSVWQRWPSPIQMLLGGVKHLTDGFARHVSNR